MKLFFFSWIITLFLPLVVGAVPPIPAKLVWVTPEQAAAGETIELSAFVYNNTEKSVVVTVGFFDGATEVARASKTILAQSALTVSASWTAPEKGTVVTAKVVSAVDTAKKAAPELIGTIGSVSIGEVVVVDTSITDTLKRHLGELFAVIEPWRKKQAHHFSTLRDAKKAVLGIDSTKEAIDALNPLPPEVPATPGAPGEEPGLEDLTPRYQGIPVGDYIVFLYAAALASIFSSVILFYIVLILLTLTVLRFLVRMVA